MSDLGFVIDKAPSKKQKRNLAKEQSKGINSSKTTEDDLDSPSLNEDLSVEMSSSHSKSLKPKKLKGKSNSTKGNGNDQTTLSTDSSFVIDTQPVKLSKKRRLPEEEKEIVESDSDDDEKDE